jgi:hypothetical protein
MSGETSIGSYVGAGQVERIELDVEAFEEAASTYAECVGTSRAKLGAALRAYLYALPSAGDGQGEEHTELRLRMIQAINTGVAHGLRPPVLGAVVDAALAALAASPVGGAAQPLTPEEAEAWLANTVGPPSDPVQRAAYMRGHDKLRSALEGDGAPEGREG